MLCVKSAGGILDRYVDRSICPFVDKINHLGEALDDLEDREVPLLSLVGVDQPVG